VHNISGTVPIGPGLEPGSMIQLRGRVGVKDAGAVMVNPAYELLS
jgi:hypothetical protein